MNRAERLNAVLDLLAEAGQIDVDDLVAKLDVFLAREGRTDLAKACFEFLPTRALLDLGGWPEVDIFAHT
jgi:ribonuclease D